jgi:hypothetical protein
LIRAPVEDVVKSTVYVTPVAPGLVDDADTDGEATDWAAVMV